MSEGKPFIKCGELFDCRDAFNKDENTDRLFFDAINEAFHWHINNCQDYKAFLMENGIADFKSKYSSDQIPPLLVDIFKQFRIISVSEKQIKIEITNEKNDKLLLDARSYKRLVKIYENIFTSLNLTDFNQKVNYLCLTFDSKFSLNSESNFYYDLLTGLTAHRSVYYAVRYNKKENTFCFNSEGAAKKLIDFSCHSEPVRIIGNIDYLMQTLNWLKNNNVNLKLPQKSCVFVFYNDTKDRDYLDSIKEICKSILDISVENIRSIFILPEQGIPYISCKCGYFHVPVYADAFVLEPESLSMVDAGEKGLLNLLTPYISSYPGISLLTTYKAILEENCPCGLNSKAFRLM